MRWGVDEGRGEMRSGFRTVRREMRDEFKSVRDEFKGVREEFKSAREEIRITRNEAREDFRLLLGIILAMFLTMILGFAGMIVATLNQVG
jgi:hypothetical protein